jgi:membrane protease YdiL (CAAX protease family)
MVLVFTTLGVWLGPRLGYLAGFALYWIGWCLVFPVLLAGPRRVLVCFRDARPRLGKPFWLGLLALLFPPAVGFSLAFPAALPTADICVIVTSAGIAVVNGIGEELLWRGLFIDVFPDRPALGYLYPTFGFALWHLAPQIIVPNTRPGGAVSFVIAAGVWGLCYGWVAWRTRSIRWTSLSHILLDFSGLGGRVYLP